MKGFTLSLVLLALGAGSSIAGDIYRHVDKDGNIIYSDQPSEGASKVEMGPINIDDSPKLKPSKPLPASQNADGKAAAYSNLTITAPEHDTTLRNASEIRVSASLTPGLRPTHQVRFLDNGVVLEPASRNMSRLITNLERGTHQLTAQVINQTGEVLISSAPVAVHVHKASLLQPRPATAPPRGAPSS